MDLIPSPPDLFQAALPLPTSTAHSTDPGTAPTATGRLEWEEVPSPGEVRDPHSYHMTEEKMNSGTVDTSSQRIVYVSMFVSLVVDPTDSSHRLFSVLLMAGWIVGCLAVVYFVFLFAWVHAYFILTSFLTNTTGCKGLAEASNVMRGCTSHLKPVNAL